MSDSNDLHDAALAAGVWAVIEAKAKEKKDEARALLASLPAGDTVSGKWDGQILAKATMVKGKQKLVVTDSRALLQWVLKNAPTEIIETVNPAYITCIEKRAKELGQPVDGEGELIPGVELQVSEPYVSVRREKNSDDVMMQLFRSGQLSLEGPE